MTERELIDLGDRVRIKDAKEILRQVLPENSGIIDKEDYQTVMRILSLWIEKLSESIKVDDYAMLETKASSCHNW